MENKGTIFAVTIINTVVIVTIIGDIIIILSACIPSKPVLDGRAFCCQPHKSNSINLALMRICSGESSCQEPGHHFESEILQFSVNRTSMRVMRSEQKPKWWFVRHQCVLRHPLHDICWQSIHMPRMHRPRKSLDLVHNEVQRNSSKFLSCQTPFDFRVPCFSLDRNQFLVQAVHLLSAENLWQLFKQGLAMLCLLKIHRLTPQMLFQSFWLFIGLICRGYGD